MSEEILTILSLIEANNCGLTAIINKLNKRKRKYLRRAYYMRRRARYLRTKALVLLLSQRFSKNIKRSKWFIQRNSNFWEIEVPKYRNKKFEKIFRVKRKTFSVLVEKLCCLQKEDTSLRKAIALDKRIAIALFALGSSVEYRTIGNIFGIGRSTVGEIVREFCAAVCDKLGPSYINGYPPAADKITEVVRGFEELGFPQCYGVVDGCHIEIKPPKANAVDYYNNKNWYSQILLAVVDHRNRFLYINTGTPGRYNKSFVFENSELKMHQSTNSLFKELSKKICNVDVPIVLLGDSAFGLSDIVLKPFPYSNDQPDLEKTFNYNLSKCRKVIDNAFSHLKSRWRRLGKGLDVNIGSTTLVINACCVLHNLCVEEPDALWENWVEEIDQSGKMQPTCTTNVGNLNHTALAIRSALAEYFSGRGNFPTAAVSDDKTAPDEDESSMSSS